ncbi:MAG: proton-conducting transporter membrane subunit [Vulcanimicrobiaceae bacterium]
MSPLALVLAAIAVATFGILLAVVVPSRAGRSCGFAALLLSSLAALAGALCSLGSGAQETMQLGAPYLALRLDPLAAFFVGVIATVAIAVSLYALGGRSAGERRTGRTAATTSCLIFLACLCVCTADNAFLFLFAWELLALGFYWAIAFAGTDERGPTAGYLTLLVTHVAGAGLVAAFFLAARGAGDFSLEHILAAVATSSDGVRDTIFVLFLIGFGAKVGLIPFQLWLPYGYPAAPATVAALMAGGALNVGFYGIVRFVVQFPGGIPLWWAIVVLALGSAGALLGIAWAAAQRDMRVLAAYSSVENAGIILAGLGVALVGRSVELRLLVGVGLAAAFLQIAAHALAKCLLFLNCETVGTQTGTTLFERLGGLARHMPVTTTTTLVAAMSLAALPPLGGFLSEWLTLEAFMQAFRTASVAAEVTLAVSGATVGIAAGISVVAFVKLVGSGFLGAARSPEAARAREDGSPFRRASVVLLATLIVLLGVTAPLFLRGISAAIDGTAGTSAVATIVAEWPLVQPAFHGFSSASALGLGIDILVFAAAFWLLCALVRRPQERRVTVWTSGEPFRPWTQYTGTGFGNPTRVILDAVVRTRRTVDGAPDVAADSPLAYSSEQRQFFDVAFYRSLAAAALRVSDAVRKTQSGVIAAYLSYILVFTIALLLLYPALRRW